MNEYLGKSVKNYGQPSDKKYTLFPALDRQIPKARGKQYLLDLGCGTGDLYQFVVNKGYRYVGIDASKDMIAEAKKKFPDENFYIESASKISNTTKEKFDVIMANMLFPSLFSIELFNSIFASMASSLKDKGLIILGIMNPYFDGYMQKRLFNREDIETKFIGYFNSGVNYKVKRIIDGKKFTFSDYHWQFSDYIIAARSVGLSLEIVDDCKPQVGLVDEVLKKKLDHPNYMVLVFKILNSTLKK